MQALKLGISYGVKIFTLQVEAQSCDSSAYGLPEVEFMVKLSLLPILMFHLMYDCCSVRFMVFFQGELFNMKLWIQCVCGRR